MSKKLSHVASLCVAFLCVALFFSKIDANGPSYLSVDLAIPEPTLEKKDPEALFLQANEYCGQGQHTKAEKLYDQSIGLRPDFYQAYFNRGLLFWQQNKFELAENDFRKAHELAPHYQRSWLLLADTLKKQNKIQKAVTEYRNLIAAHPDNFEAYLHLGRIFSDAHKFDIAVTLFEHALQVRPASKSCRLDYANTLNMMHRTQEALDNYKMIEADSNANVLHNIAYTYKKLGNMENALVYYEKTLRANPNHAEAKFGLGCTQIMLEDFIDGFAGYEWRWNRKRKPFPVPEGIPKWNGFSDLQGKTVLLQAEQGLGDSFQFIRYGRELKARGAHVVFAAQNPLIQLLSACDYLDEVVSIHLTPPPCDMYVSLMSLPHMLKTTVETIPLDIPYLKANKNLVTHWKQELAKDKNFKIGICWQGNPNYSTPFLRSAVADKSVQLKQFQIIHDIPGVSLYCLQKTSGEEQLENLSDNFSIKVFGPDFDNANGRFMDTAAVMKNLDLVLTVDTSIAHLAGGLGVPVWVVLPEPADWRWMLRKSDTPWYPDMKLFRQPKTGDWDSVFTTVAQKLKKLVASKNSKKKTKQKPNTDTLCNWLEQSPWGR